VRRLTAGMALIGLALWGAGCGGPHTAGMAEPRPTPTLIATVTPAPPSPVQIVDRELLGAAAITVGCDAPPEANLACETEANAPRLTVSQSAATYGRWRLQWQNAKPLTGDEVLALHMVLSGDLSPNLYLVQQDGSRMHVPLRRFGLDEGEHAVHVPLREVRDAEGNTPDFAQVNEIQIVFEWADMAGTLELQSLRLLSVWAEQADVAPAAVDLAAGLQVPAGFVVEALADDLLAVTQIEFTPQGDMLASLQEGRIWRYRDADGDGRYDSRLLYAAGFTEAVGLLVDPVDGAVWVGGRGRLYRTLDMDGDGAADVRELRLDGLPWGRHQNNGLAWNPNPDPFTGEPGGAWIYFGLGSTGDLETGGELSAAVLRFPHTGQGLGDVEVVSRGNRNAYDVVWAPVPVDLADTDGATAWQLFASENGPDFNDAPDEVNHILWQRHYGFPEQFGPVEPPSVEGDPYTGPVYAVTPHASADGLAYIANPRWPAAYRTLYVALFGEVFHPTPVGHTVERVVLRQATLPDGALTYRGEPSDFVAGLDRPLPLAVDPAGDLVVGDYATGVVYAVRYAGE